MKPGQVVRLILIVGVSLTGAAGMGIAQSTGPVAGAPSDAAHPEYFSLSVEPPKPLVITCGTLGNGGYYAVHPGDVVRLRIAGILDDGRLIDLTGDPSLQYRISDRTVGSVSPHGWIRFLASDRAIGSVQISFVSGKWSWAVEFAVVTRDPVDLPQSVVHLVADEFPEFRIPGPSDLVADWAMPSGGYPFVARADFDGDGLQDVALTLIGTSEWKTVILRQKEGGVYETAYTEGGKFGRSLEVRCSQNIRIYEDGMDGEPDSTPHRMLVVETVSEANTHHIFWKGDHFESVGIDYGE